MIEITKRERDAIFEEFLRAYRGEAEILAYESLLAKASGRRVTIVGGYSALGYEDPDAVRVPIENLVLDRGDGSLYALGGTTDGVGAAYEWISDRARSAGFGDVKTAGIVSREAARYPEGIARQDYLVFVDTRVGEWRVLRDGVSLLVDFARRTGGEMVFFKGGAISGAEIEDALACGVPVVLHAGSSIEPNRERLEAKRNRSPETVSDGTHEIVAKHHRHPHPCLTVIR